MRTSRTPQLMSKPGIAPLCQGKRSCGGVFQLASCRQALPFQHRDKMGLIRAEGGEPTPPGDTTASGFPISNAATFPMAKPYPAWTSGSAIDLQGCSSIFPKCFKSPSIHTNLPTIPGNAATFAICFIAGRKPPTAPENWPAVPDDREN